MRKIVAIPVAACMSIAVAACDDSPTAARVEVAWLVNAAVTGLDDGGLFKLPEAPPGELSKTAAVRLAEAYVRYFGRWLEPSWSADHGADIDHESLRSCGRTYYASTNYRELPAAIDRQTRAHVGPRWLVTLCGGNVPQVTIAVSALATDLQVGQGPTGGFFVSRGIPASVPQLTMSPEAAAQQVYEMTGRRIATVPELVMPSLPSVPQLAKWRIALEAPVTVEGERSKVRRTVQVVYVGMGRSWHWSGLQAADPVDVPRVVAGRSGPGGREVPLEIRPGFAGSLEAISVEKR